jgi:YafQ family addiction module toxin component
MYSFKIEDRLHKKFDKISKRDFQIIKIIRKKIQEVIQNPQHYKNLRAPLNKFKRIHVAKSFVLIFQVDEKNKIVKFYDLDHHDRIYL